MEDQSRLEKRSVCICVPWNWEKQNHFRMQSVGATDAVDNSRDFFELERSSSPNSVQKDTKKRSLIFLSIEIEVFGEFFERFLVFDKSFYVEFKELYQTYCFYLEQNGKERFAVPKRKLWGLLNLFVKE